MRTFNKRHKKQKNKVLQSITDRQQKNTSFTDNWNHFRIQFEKFYSLHLSHLIGVATKVGIPRENAYDVVQDVMLSVFQRGNPNLLTMSYVVPSVVNRAINEKRRLSKFVDINDNQL